MDNIDAKSLLQFQVEKDVKYLYKRFLSEIEDLRTQHVAMLIRLEKVLPAQYHQLLKAANFFDEKEFAHRRKRILDMGNEAVRNLLEQVERFDVDFDIKQRNKENEQIQSTV